MVLLVALLAGVAVLVTGTPHQLLCPEGWTDTIGECVKVFRERQNWLLARKICQANGGDLLGSKYHQDLNTHLLGLLEDGNTGGLWIGLYAPSGRNSLRFVDGSKPDEGTKTLREYRVTPIERDTREKRCVKLSHRNTWVGIKCTAIHKFICEKPYYELQCPNGWMVSPWSASCIRLERKKKSWDDARGRCHELGADLVKIVNDKMNQLITTYMIEKPRTGYWIGLRSRFDFDGNEFKWLDEQHPAKYTSWGKFRPRTRFPANCAVVHDRAVEKGLWSDANCEAKRSPMEMQPTPSSIACNCNTWEVIPAPDIAHNFKTSLVTPLPSITNKFNFCISDTPSQHSP
ncbi:hypothetical protein RRG08_048336 [Elysia crispata]|uniref:C-type lectin domain-containing protein n=1 Tax=Elysia crispata TaxID=231223 RepID=A0AAE1DKQ2_9GAST|nr:hypothetical protein RRG08_048336 [Elysia crispata]